MFRFSPGKDLVKLGIQTHREYVVMDKLTQELYDKLDETVRLMSKKEVTQYYRECYPDDTPDKHTERVNKWCERQHRKLGEEYIPTPKVEFHHVYSLCDGDGEVLYIGVTNDPKIRQQQHKRDKEFVYMRVLQQSVNREEMEDLEVKLIKEYNPPLNITHTHSITEGLELVE